METASARIRKFLFQKKVRLDPSSDESAPLLDSGTLKSVMVIQLVAFLEMEFSIRLDAEDITAENFQSLRSMSLLVEKKLSQDGR